MCVWTIHLSAVMTLRTSRYEYSWGWVWSVCRDNTLLSGDDTENVMADPAADSTSSWLRELGIDQTRYKSLLNNRLRPSSEYLLIAQASTSAGSFLLQPRPVESSIGQATEQAVGSRMANCLQYDTIWYAMLMCSQKLTWVSLIYCTAPTTKKWKNRKSKKWTCSEVSLNSVGNPWSPSWRRKGRLRWEGFTEKGVFVTCDVWNMKVLVFFDFVMDSQYSSLRVNLLSKPLL